MYKRKYDTAWNFKEGKMNEINHLIHPYPAMLMPLIVRNLLCKYGTGKDTVIFDPYVGSGTTLVESLKYGVGEACGVDLNPLAIMISKAKVTKYNINDISEIILRFKPEFQEIDYTSSIENDDIHNFSIRNSWFKPKNIIELDYLKTMIESIEDEKIKLFLNVSFSQTVRNVSLTRNGEFKLYRIPKNKIDDFNPNAIEKFYEILNKNLDMIKIADRELNYGTKITIHQIDINKINTTFEYNEKFNLVITSPPYGDSHTTVAYGQFSRLANEWLNIKNANQIDSLLFGGKTKVDLNTFFDIPELDDVIRDIKKYDEAERNKRHPDVISFYIDYINSIKTVAQTVKLNGYVIYVVGNRRVRNIELPTDVITAKSFEKLGFVHEETIVRDILNKRMPSKASPDNRVGGQISTMTKEYIVIMKKVR